VQYTDRNSKEAGETSRNPTIIESVSDLSNLVHSQLRTQRELFGMHRVQEGRSSNIENVLCKISNPDHQQMNTPKVVPSSLYKPTEIFDFIDREV